eukprot:TRINITY_DN1285_c0_g1_i1.p1 TRINITY_DN1285_c0_g1~~TRINITY_DN1285_c0_g1_i1.p1  ORF type:complete len:788 (+),score=179.45 TRINITY_DN1285_c0_g1_i1:96-2459(+)
MDGNNGYFSEFRKGEVNELMQLLKSVEVERNPEKQREVIKKVIAYMTLGIDVSRLFSSMVMACNTRDMVQKKLVYLYLCTYAEQYPSLSLLAINTLQKDCRDDNPMVRGLALRSMSSLRLPQLVEYLLPPLKVGLSDPSPYVRKTAVLGLAKVFRISPSYIRETGVINKLYDMIRDRDGQVVTNAIHSLDEILKDEGGMAVNKPIMVHLLSRLKEFNEWSQSFIISLMLRYQPSDEDEIIDLFNVLEEKIRHSNSAVVMEAVNVFLKFSELVPQLQEEVYLRLKAPLLTVFVSSGPEISHACLRHLILLVAQHKAKVKGASSGLFDEDYKFFFCKSSDPAYLKHLKVKALVEISCEKNMHELVNELSEYVTDMDTELAKLSVKAIGQLAVKLPQVAEHSIERLMSFLDLSINYLSTVTLVVTQDILRKYPHFSGQVIGELKQCLSSVDDPEAKAATVWMLGEYGEDIPESPYLLEDMASSFSEEVSSVRLQMLTSTIKLFFKRPAECQPILGRLLETAVADTSDMDVHDRALFYYRLLCANVHEANRVVSSAKTPVMGAFLDDQLKEYQDDIFREFNTLSVIFAKPSHKFIKALLPSSSSPSTAAADNDSDSSSSTFSSDKNSTLLPSDEQMPRISAEHLEQHQTGGYSGNGNTSSSSSSSDGHKIELKKRPSSLSPQGFQNKWSTWETAQGMVEVHKANMDGSLLSKWEKSLQQSGVLCMASGVVDGVSKYYFYAQHHNTRASFFLVETIVTPANNSFKFVVKSDEQPDLCLSFVSFFRDSIVSLN